MPTALHRIAEPLRWQEFDGEWVVYLPKAGVLIQLPAFDATVLSLVEEAPASKASVADRIAAVTECPLSAALLEQVAVTVDALRQSRLIEPVDGAPAW